MKYKGVLIGLLLTILLLSSCGSELTNEEIQAKMILANDEITSFFVDTIITNAIVFEGENYTSTTKNLMLNGDVDLVNQNGFLNVELILQKDDGLSVAEEKVATLYYVLGDNMFLELRNELTDENVWVREPFDEDLWNQQVQFTQIMEFLKGGSVEKVDEEDGFFIIKVKPSDTVLANIIKEEYGKFFSEEADIRTAIDTYILLVWVDQESFLIKRSQSDLKVVLTSSNSLLQEGVEATITSHMKSKISELGKEVELNVPEEALDAQSLESFKVEILEKSSKEIEEVNAELERIMKEREEMVHRIENKKPKTLTKNALFSGNESSS